MPGLATAVVERLLLVERALDLGRSRSPRRPRSACRRRCRRAAASRRTRCRRGRSEPPSEPISCSAASSASRSAAGVSRITLSVGSISICAVPLEAGRRRDQLADDHVLLEAEQVVDLALDRRVREHLGGLLEGGRREEGLGRERRLRDPEDQRLVRRLLVAFFSFFTRTFSRSSTTRSTSWPGRSSVSPVLDAHLLQHLPDDHLDVLVVDVDALRLVDLLHLADEVQLGRRRALEGSSSAGVCEPSWSGSPSSTSWPFSTSSRVRRGSGYVTGSSGSPFSSRPSWWIVTFGPRSSGSISTRPATSRQLRRALRVAGLEDLDDARETVRDVRAGHAARVERPHRQLRARLADRLGGDDADRVADLEQVAGRQEDAVAGAAEPDLGAALQHRADRDAERVHLLVARRPRSARARGRSSASCPSRPSCVLPGSPDLSGLNTSVASMPAEQALVDPVGGPERQLDVILGPAVVLADDHVLRRRRPDAGSGSPSRPCAARCRRGPCGRRASR